MATTRRRFLAAALAAGAAPLASFLYAWRVESGWIDFVHRSLPIAGLPSALAGATLVQHVDRGLGHLIPVRFNVRPEITVFQLQPADRRAARA